MDYLVEVIDSQSSESLDWWPVKAGTAELARQLAESDPIWPRGCHAGGVKYDHRHVIGRAV
jgi:hypothetical protein